MLIATAMGWAASALLCALHLRTRRRLVLVARASHEVRGPLCAARLGLDTLAAEPSRVAAIDFELRRAGRALDDLTAAPSGGRAPERCELIDLAALAAAQAPVWRALAAAQGAGFHLEPPLPAASVSAPPVATASLPPAIAASPLVAGIGTPSPPATEGPRRLMLVPPAAGAADPPPSAVFADPLRIAQACANLVANAAEHGGGVVRVRVRALAGAVRLEVADDGPGLPAPVAVLAARSRLGRRGHGLAVAAEIVADHGGRLTAAPGARVVIELPAAAPAAEPRRRAVAPPPIVA